jgi:hypothetical protein
MRGSELWNLAACRPGSKYRRLKRKQKEGREKKPRRSLSKNADAEAFRQDRDDKLVEMAISSLFRATSA